FMVFQEFLTEFLRGRSRFVHYGIFKYLLPPVFFIGFLVLFKYLNWQEETIMLGYLLGFSVLFLVLMFLFPFGSVNSKEPYGYKKLFNLSFPMMFSAAFLFLSNWTDVFMLGAMVSKAEVGVYNAAYKLAILALIVINAVNTVIAPKISELYSTNKISAIKAEVQKATKLITYATIPIVLILLVFSESLLGLFGPEFKTGRLVLMIVSVGLLFNAMSGSVGQVLNMTQHQNLLKRFTLISVVVNVGLNYILIKKMGIEGAAVASLVSNMVLNILCLIFIKKEFNFYAFFIPWR
ncbi:MAG: flippase, partial [Bacteroidota bacterium]